MKKIYSELLDKGGLYVELIPMAWSNPSSVDVIAAILGAQT